MSKKNKNKSNQKPTIPAGNNTIAIKPKWQHILLIILLTAIVYSNTLNNEFVYDDLDTIQTNSLIRDVKNIPMFFMKPILSSSPLYSKGYRPLTMVSFTLNYAIGKLNVEGYHIVNILLHALNAVMVYILSITLFSLLRKDGNPGYKYISMIALSASLIFATHPINSEAVNYIWQRSVLLSTLFYMIAAILFLKGSVISNHKLYMLSIISCGLALLSKEIAITFPLIILLLDWYFISKYKKDKILKNIKKYHIYVIILSGMFICIKFFGHGEIREFGSIEKASPIIYLFTQFKVIIKYISMLILPDNLSVYHIFHFSKGVSDVLSWISLAILIAIIIISIKMKKISKAVSFFILWFFITLIPTSSILPLKVIINEHRLYLPGVGIVIAINALVFRLLFNIRYKKLLGVLLAVIIITLSGVTYSRNKAWENGITLWSSVLEIYPESKLALANLGCAYKNKDRNEEAMDIFNTIISKYPKYYLAYGNRGNIYKEMGEIDKALDDYTMAINIHPKYIRVYNYRGIIYDKKGLYDRAIIDYTKAIEINPLFSKAYNNRGKAYEMKNMLNEALADYNKAISINKNDAIPYGNRGIVYSKMGFFNKSKEDFSKAIDVNPEHVKSYCNRGASYGKQGLYDKAIMDFKKAINLNPEYANAYINIGILYWKKGIADKTIEYLSKAIKLDPENWHYYNTRSVIYRNMGRESLAQKDEEKAKSLMKRE